MDTTTELNSPSLLRGNENTPTFAGEFKIPQKINKL